MGRIPRVEAAVQRLAPVGAAAGYAGLDAPRFVRCRVVTEDGLAGTGATGRFLAPEVAHFLAGPVAEVLVGADPRSIEAIRRARAARFHPRGGTGLFVAAFSALDMALWDLCARALGEPHGVPTSHAGGWDIANAAVMGGHAHGGLLEMHGAQLALRARLSEDLVPEGGVMTPPERPGIGFAFRDGE